MSTSSWSSLLARTAREVVTLLRPAGRTGRGSRTPGARSGSEPGPATGAPSKPVRRTDYPGDFNGPVTAVYSPALDGDADPGEIVWTWVPYEEDFSRGKDRPVLIVGHDGAWLLGLMLTSKDHARGAPSRAGGPQWLDIGSGPWDAQGRPSEIRLDRVVRVDPSAVRREGAIMDRVLFEKITAFLPRP